MPDGIGHQLAGQQKRPVHVRVGLAKDPGHEVVGRPHLLGHRRDRHALADSAADIKDTEPPRPRKGTANNGERRTDAPSTPPATSSHRPPAWLPGSPAHPRFTRPDYARPSNIKSGRSGPTERVVYTNSRLV